jgi:hypothetical protein
MSIETLIAKIPSLSASGLKQVEDFVDFLIARDEDRALSRAASRLSEDSLQRVWDNSDDADYDRL